MGSESSKLISASKRGDINGVKLSLGRDANIEHVDSDGYTALIWASASGYIEIVEYLLEWRGTPAKLEVRQHNNWTALLCAAMHGHVDIVEYLIKKGSDIEWKDDRGWTPLLWAAANNFRYTTKALIDAKADVNVKDSKGITALILSARNIDCDTVKILVEAGADIHATTLTNETALSVARTAEIKAYLYTQIEESKRYSHLKELISPDHHIDETIELPGKILKKIEDTQNIKINGIHSFDENHEHFKNSTAHDVKSGDIPGVPLAH